MKIQNFEIFELHAQFCRVIANPKRLMILALLHHREMSVGELAESIGVPLATISQHLALLRNRNMVESRKEGQTVFYRVADDRLMEACTIIRSVLLDAMKRRGEIAQHLDLDDIVLVD